MMGQTCEVAAVGDVLNALELIAPSNFAFEFDKVGLQVGSLSSEIRTAVVSLDRSQDAIQFAIDERAELLLAHHPLLFHPFYSVTTETLVGRSLLSLIEHGIAFIAAHTNWDCAKGGVNDALCNSLGLLDIASFGSYAERALTKLVVYAPQVDVERIIDAASSAGAGEIGCYERCAFVGQGHGTFYGKPGSVPAVGNSGAIESVEEFRIEMITPYERRATVEEAVRMAHSYEEPAIDFTLLAPSRGQPIGRLGALKDPISLRAFRALVDEKLGTCSLGWGDPDSTIEHVAVVGGSADDEWRRALSEGAQVLVTGEVKQHVALEATESGIAIIAAGHYATEQPGVVALATRLATQLPSIEWQVFEPPAGRAGRPFHE